MKCDKCNNPSVYHSTLIVNGVKESTHLCRDCAIKEGVFNAQPSSIFDDLFDSFADFLPFEKVENIVCPVCRTSLREFKNTHKLGCPNCYEIFKEEIEKIVARIEPFARHKQDSIKAPKVKTPLTKEEKIKALRDDMAKAVKEERYEDAGKIKKQIQKLENQNE